MQYRQFGKSGVRVSALGFGMMRLPVIDGDAARIDVEKTRELVRYAADHGVNYFDTAYVYHREQSEIVTGRILKEEGLRDKVYLATKCPHWMAKTQSDLDGLLATELQRLDTDHIDMYLMHALHKERFTAMGKINYDKFLDQAKADGRIRFAGFSFHDDLATFKRIVDAYPWDFCQIQYNYLDENYQAGTEGLKYAAAKGLPVVIMEPLRGGRLTRPLPAELAAIWSRAEHKRSSADWALSWVLDHPEVAVVLSGMNTLDQVKENVAIADRAHPNTLTEAELKLYREVQAFFKERAKVTCTRCAYCMPCPQKITIPDLFDAYNDANIYDTRAKVDYARIKTNAGDPANCAECGRCEAQCPQHLPIRKHLKELDAYFSQPVK